MPSLYNLKIWRQLRKAQLQAEPFCRFCAALQLRTPATVVDHVKPHKGDFTLFADPDNLQSLCKPCHDSTKRRFEHSGVMIGGDVTGRPIDPNHHWNKSHE